MSTRRGTEWMNEGLCAQVDSEIFFPPLGGSTLPAKRICAECPVRLECLDYALTTYVEGAGDRMKPMDGVWGGTSTEERAILRGGGKRRGRDKILARLEVAA